MNLSSEIEHKLSAVSRLNGEFDAWLLGVSSSPYRSAGISKQLLLTGDVICHEVDEHAYRCLIGAVAKSSGVGKGVFLTTLKFMPETFARVQLKTWALEGALQATTPDLWQSGLTHALSSDRLRLGLDIISQMERRSHRFYVINALATLDDDVLAKIPMAWEPYSEDLVGQYCSTESFSRAQEFAVTPRAKQLVMNSVAKAVGMTSKPDNWPGVMRHMIKRAKFDGGSDELITKHRSAAIVVVNEILSLDDDEIVSQLNTDELRVMAYKLGLESAVSSIQSLEARSQAFVHDLAI